MSAPSCAVRDVTVRFVGLAPSEEVVHWVHRCAARNGRGTPLIVVLSAAPSGDAHDVRVQAPGLLSIRERDADPLLAVRNAFDRLAVAWP